MAKNKKSGIGEWYGTIINDLSARKHYSEATCIRANLKRVRIDRYSSSLYNFARLLIMSSEIPAVTKPPS